MLLQVIFAAGDPPEAAAPRVGKLFYALFMTGAVKGATGLRMSQFVLLHPRMQCLYAKVRGIGANRLLHGGFAPPVEGPRASFGCLLEFGVLLFIPQDHSSFFVMFFNCFWSRRGGQMLHKCVTLTKNRRICGLLATFWFLVWVPVTAGCAFGDPLGLSWAPFGVPW